MYEENLAHFSSAMNNQLEANKGRGGFRGRPHSEVIAELRAVVNELETRVECPWSARLSSGNLQCDVLALSADVANLAMIIAINTGGLKARPFEEAAALAAKEIGHIHAQAAIEIVCDLAKQLPEPAHFMDWKAASLRVDESQAKAIRAVAGVKS